LNSAFRKILTFFNIYVLWWALQAEEGAVGPRVGGVLVWRGGFAEIFGNTF
jgi:hypothetical protein